jgi:hypothetical protein
MLASEFDASFPARGTSRKSLAQKGSIDTSQLQLMHITRRHVSDHTVCLQFKHTAACRIATALTLNPRSMPLDNNGYLKQGSEGACF